MQMIEKISSFSISLRLICILESERANACVCLLYKICTRAQTRNDTGWRSSAARNSGPESNANPNLMNSLSPIGEERACVCLSSGEMRDLGNGIGRLIYVRDSFSGRSFACVYLACWRAAVKLDRDSELERAAGACARVQRPPWLIIDSDDAMESRAADL